MLLQAYQGDASACFRAPLLHTLQANVCGCALTATGATHQHIGLGAEKIQWHMLYTWLHWNMPHNLLCKLQEQQRQQHRKHTVLATQ